VGRECARKKKPADGTAVTSNSGAVVAQRNITGNHTARRISPHTRINTGFAAGAPGKIRTFNQLIKSPSGYGSSEKWHFLLF
jgi:hypothetical protein